MLKSLSIHTRFVLAFLAAMFALRLFHITDPPIEVAHNWRQTTSLMVARNFHQLDANILYPTIDETGENRGVVGMEFPAIPFAIHLISIPFGYDHWYGRLIVLLIVTMGSWYFYLLSRLYLQEKTAMWATILFTASSLIHLGRKVMPDPAALSLVIVALYYGFAYLKEGRIPHLLAYFLFATLGTLIKIPFGLYLALLAFPFFQSNVSASKKAIFATASFIVLTVVGWWYFSWNVHLADTYGQWYNSGKSISKGATELGAHLSEVFQRFYFSAYHSYVWGIISIASIPYLIYKRSKVATATSVILLPLIVLYMLKSGCLFSHHGYYALILVPWLALCGSLFFEQLHPRIAVAVLSIGFIESVANQQHDFFIKPELFNKLQLETIATQISERNELVGLVSNANPNEFYFLNRKGWLVAPDQCTDEYLKELKMRGCCFLFVPAIRRPVAISFPIVFENEFYSVFKLK